MPHLPCPRVLNHHRTKISRLLAVTALLAAFSTAHYAPAQNVTPPPPAPTTPAYAPTAPTASPAPAPLAAYKNFKIAVYIPVGVVNNLRTLQTQWESISRLVKVDKVYFEVYRSTRFVDENLIEQVKQFFQAQGVQVAGGASLDISEGSQFQTFSFANPGDRALAARAMTLAAKHFDEVILDDFFFNNQKTDADIAAKGAKSWTQYRLDLMDDVAKNVVLKSAKDANPNCKVIIKFPNWYEHFQALGFDLDQEPKIFDGIFTGTETRDPTITDQCLQQYESYEIFRYYENIKPGHNGGGWVDTFSINYLDRYCEQLADTLFAKAPELVLFNWSDLNRVAPSGDRPWSTLDTSFSYSAIQKYFQDHGGTPAGLAGGRGRGAAVPADAVSWAAAAGFTASQVDAFLGQLGHPIGLASYKPYQSSGEDFLHNFLGMIGLPIELYPAYPADADTVLLTESAGFDPDLVAKIKASLAAGHDVVITSGLLRVLGHSLDDIVELAYTDRKIAVRSYVNGYGAGSGTNIGANTNGADILFPEIHFFTNDAWPILRGLASGRGYPIMLMDHYSQGTLYLLNIPDNFNDLYNLPQAVLTNIRGNLMQRFPVRLDAPAQVSLFAYDNQTFIVQSFLPTATDVQVSVAGRVAQLRDLVTGQPVAPLTAPAGRGRGGNRGNAGPARTTFTVHLPPHSYAVFSAAP
jgi:hypothetical protein